MEARTGDSDSVLALYRTALRLRREHRGHTAVTWRDAGPDLLDFASGDALRVVLNLGGATAVVPASAGTRPLVSSGPLQEAADGSLALPSDTAVWLPRP